jgi:hypothetical protein
MRNDGLNRLMSVCDHTTGSARRAAESRRLEQLADEERLAGMKGSAL